jgi:hypothetical protein
MVVTGTLSAQEKYVLKAELAPGKYLQTVKVKTVSNTKAGGMKHGIPVTQEQTFKILLDVSEPETNGTQKVKMAITEYKMNQSAMGQQMVYDSTNPDKSGNKPLDKVLEAMTKMEFTFDLTQEGKAENYKGIEEFWEKMAQGLSESSIAKEMFESMKKSFGDEMISKMAGEWENFHDKTPRAVGEEWKSTSQAAIPMLGETETEVTSKLESVEGDIAVITGHGIIKSAGNEMEMGPMKFQVNDTSIITSSTTKFRLKTKRPEETVTEAVMKMSMTMIPGENFPIPDGKPMEMEMDSTSTTVVTTEAIQ